MKKNKSRMVGGDSLLTNETYHIIGEIHYLCGDIDAINGFYKVHRDYPSDSYWVDLIRLDTRHPKSDLDFRLSFQHGDRLQVATFTKSNQDRWNT